MTTISVIKLLPENQIEVKSFADRIKNAVLNGEINPIELDYHLKVISDMVETIRKDKDVRECTLNEMSKCGKSFSYKDAEITLSERKSYDYSNDHEWTKLKEKMKARETILKNVPEGTAMVDEETGEIYNAPLIKRSDVITYNKPKPKQ